jgi:hypothetical protein
MGLIHNILISVIHLVFVAMDILLTMILIKLIYERWKIKCLKPIIDAIGPLMMVVMNTVQNILVKVTGKTHPERTTLIFTVISIWLTRIIVASLF